MCELGAPTGPPASGVDSGRPPALRVALSEQRTATATASLACICTHRQPFAVCSCSNPATHRDRPEEPPTTTTQAHAEQVIAPTEKDINKQMAAHISWSRTTDLNARTRPAREAFLRRFDREVDPDGVLPPAERCRRAQHALRAHMLRLAKRSVDARRRPQWLAGEAPPERSSGGALDVPVTLEQRNFRASDLPHSAPY